MTCIMAHFHFSMWRLCTALCPTLLVVRAGSIDSWRRFVGCFSPFKTLGIACTRCLSLVLGPLVFWPSLQWKCWALANIRFWRRSPLSASRPLVVVCWSFWDFCFQWILVALGSAVLFYCSFFLGEFVVVIHFGFLLFFLAIHSDFIWLHLCWVHRLRYILTPGTLYCTWFGDGAT